MNHDKHIEVIFHNTYHYASRVASIIEEDHYYFGSYLTNTFGEDVVLGWIENFSRFTILHKFIGATIDAYFYDRIEDFGHTQKYYCWLSKIKGPSESELEKERLTEVEAAMARYGINYYKFSKGRAVNFCGEFSL